MDRDGFAIVKCVSCGFMFASVPENFDAASVYDDDSYWSGGKVYGYADYDQDFKQWEKFYLARLSRIESFVRGRRLLEVGCAAGYFLRAARDRGWQIAGVELSNAMRTRCASDLGCAVYTSIADAAASEQKFDCVAMFDVIEHLPQPVRALREIGSLIVKDGLLAVATPNFEGPEAKTGLPLNKWFAPPAHLSYFGPRTLPKCVELAGFEPIAIEGLFSTQEMPIPAPIAAMLAPLRRGKRLRPRGILGKALKWYQHRRPDAVYWMDTLELYARNPNGSPDAG